MRTILFILAAAAVLAPALAHAQSGPPGTWTCTYYAINNAGNQEDETPAYTAISDGDTHRFVGSFSEYQTITGSSFTTPPWDTPFTPLQNVLCTRSYDTTVTFPHRGQQAWVLMYWSSEEGEETFMYVSQPNGPLVSRQREWYTPLTSPAVSGPY